jgi:mono/diheme cytochrome c family protein
MAHTHVLRFVLLASMAFLASCIDPVHDDAVAALGDEVSGVREGPTHRPGQPCLTCHGGVGPGPDFQIAGTVFETEGKTTPAPGVKVTLTEPNGAFKDLTTNTAGNFYVEEGRYTPTYPLRVTLTRDGISKEMLTRIGRRSGCADCHRAGGSQALAPIVYLKAGSP